MKSSKAPAIPGEQIPVLPKEYPTALEANGVPDIGVRPVLRCCTSTWSSDAGARPNGVSPCREEIEFVRLGIVVGEAEQVLPSRNAS